MKYNQVIILKNGSVDDVFLWIENFDGKIDGDVYLLF